MEMWESVMGTLGPHTSSLVVESGWAWCVCVLLLQEGSNSQLLCLPHKHVFKNKVPGLSREEMEARVRGSPCSM